VQNREQAIEKMWGQSRVSGALGTSTDTVEIAV